MAKGEYNILANPLSHVYTQVTREGNSSQEQKEYRLKHCWR